MRGAQVALEEVLILKSLKRNERGNEYRWRSAKPMGAKRPSQQYLGMSFTCRESLSPIERK
jgi:phage protein U